jgi:RimJ/RimL family protein N-acetyltransferase
MEKPSSEPIKFIPEIDLEAHKPYRNSKYILEMKRLKPDYALALQKALQRGTEHIAGYFEWGENASKWNTWRCLIWIQTQLRDVLPREHFAFFLGPDLVGMGSLIGHLKNRHVQQMYWVSEGFRGQGIGESIALSLERLALINRPYEAVFIEHDSSNTSSGKIPQALGYNFLGTFDSEVHAKKETGLWYSYVKWSNRYSNYSTERLKDLRYAELYCEMVQEMHPAIYEETYKESHLEAKKALALELELAVRTDNQEEVA